MDGLFHTFDVQALPRKDQALDLNGATREPYSPTCVFCNRLTLDNILWQSAHFFLLGDHAPLTPGHLLLVPKGHYACYGAVPAALEDEFLMLKDRVVEFMRATYRTPVFFEHGVFHQTVFHAHLHAFPFGSVTEGIYGLIGEKGATAQSLADVRAWYAERGQYFYLEQPATPTQPAEAAIFPPDERVYFQTLVSLRQRSEIPGDWAPPALRRMTAGPKVRALIEAWRAYTHVDLP